MKIGVNLINFNTPELTGTGYFAKRLLSVISEKYQHRVTFVLFLQQHMSASTFGLDDSQNSVVVVKTPEFTSRISRIFYEQFILPFKLNDVDVIYSPSVAVPFFARKKKVNTIHDMTPFMIDLKYRFYQRWYIMWLTRFTVYFCDSIITVSENSKSDIVELTGINPDKVEVIYNFIPGGKPQKHPIKSDEVEYFISVSTIQPGKNIENAMEAFDRFVRETGKKDFKYYIIGKDGWDFKKIREKKKHLEYGSKIEFTGYLEEEELNSFYERARALIYVSFYEGFGLPPLEAMHYLTPSVVSNNSSLPEVVGKTGVLVDPNSIESIKEGMKSVLIEKVRKELIGTIPGQLKKFDPDTQVNKFLNLMQKDSVD